MSLYDRLVELISEKGLSIRQFELKCGFSNGTIKRWRDHSPNIESIIIVAQILNTSIDYLVYGSSSNITTHHIKDKVDIFNRLVYLIESKNITIKEFERNCGLANATIRRWKNHVPNLDSISKVAQQLNISIDYLIFGSDDSSPASNSIESVPERTITLSENEFALIGMYRFLQERDRRTVFDFIEMLYKQTAGKRASTYSMYKDDGEEGNLTNPEVAVKNDIA